MDMGQYIYEKFSYITDEFERRNAIYKYYQEFGLDELGDNGCIANQLCDTHLMISERIKTVTELRDLLSTIKIMLQIHQGLRGDDNEISKE